MLEWHDSSISANCFIVCSVVDRSQKIAVGPGKTSAGNLQKGSTASASTGTKHWNENTCNEMPMKWLRVDTNRRILTLNCRSKHFIFLVLVDTDTNSVVREHILHKHGNRKRCIEKFHLSSGYGMITGSAVFCIEFFMHA